MSEQNDREALANLIPLGFTERDPYRDVYEAADAILAWMEERDQRVRAAARVEFSRELTLLGVHTLDIHDIRRRARRPL